MKKLFFPWRLTTASIAVAIVAADADTADSPVTHFTVTPTSLVSRDEPPLQRIDLAVETSEPLAGCVLQVRAGDRVLAEKPLDDLKAGANKLSVLLPEPDRTAETNWVLSKDAKPLAGQTLSWNLPRHWTLYVIKSAHVDIGLHDPQYKQRLMTVGNIDQARKLADETAGWPEASRYRYVIEGLWWWSNYPRDRSERAANQIVENYVKRGIFDIGASHSGNHTQTYGMEEMCRSAYYVRELRKRWGVSGETMLMVDNNGISWPLVTAYADAGIRNLIFLPNAWNPKTIGNSRVDVEWTSELPHLFYWQGPDASSRLLFWANPHYINTGQAFGIETCERRKKEVPNIEAMAPKMAEQLAFLESRVPYDLWVVSNYDDNEPPNLRFPEMARAWNATWRWPELRTVGDLSEPFREVEKRFGDKIPTLRGMITGGWAQHPLSTPNLLAEKRAADRLLPVAEKLATLARLSDPDFVYPALRFRRAWDALICNDEHGYGVSYYKGRPVYDTWMQKRDWITRGLMTAEEECSRALKALAALAPADSPSVFVFNPTLQPRAEIVEVELPDSCAGWGAIRRPDGPPAPAVAAGERLRFRTAEIPPMGYAVFPLGKGKAEEIAKRSCAEPPAVENDFYRVTFGADGSITGIFDKRLGRQLVDASAPHRCNQLVYTRDVHKTFSSPAEARFEIENSPLGQTVIARMDDPVSGAAIEQRVTLPAHEKRIDIDNRLDHVRDLASKDRWNRFGYYAFPFDVPEGAFRVGLNGCSADPYQDQTGHGTDSYHAARDWSHVGNGEFGVTLAQLDSQLVECGKIHEKKNTFGEGPSTSHLYSYIFTDWLYGHAFTTGPSHINLRYRYVITSHAGDFEKAQAPQFAERAVTPVLATVISPSKGGKLPAATHSFLSVDTPGVSLLTLKLSETPGRGVIARFHETGGHPVEAVNLAPAWGQDLRLTRCSITEEDREALDRPAFRLDPFGYATLRIEQPGPPPAAPKPLVGDCSDRSVVLEWQAVADARQYYVYRGEDAGFPADEYHLLAATRQPNHTDDWLSPGTAYFYRVAAVTAGNRQGDVSDAVAATTRAAGDSPPAKVGAFYTGLISDPRAWRGDDPDTLYLEWGQNRESDLSHYELYRGDSPDFEPGEATFVAKVEPGPYVVATYEDKGLKPHTAYHYRVRAVDRDGHKGQPSDICRGVTREP